MNLDSLKQYFATADMVQNDLGVGVVTIYRLNNKRFYLVMGDYHNRSALTPTVGARYNKEHSIYDTICDAFERKRFNGMQFDPSEIVGEESIDEQNIYYSVNKKLARLTFVQHIELNLSEDVFKEKYIDPIHKEAQYQGSGSNFFWRLDETIKGNQKFSFKSNEDRAKAAQKALDSISKSKFKMSDAILQEVVAMRDTNYQWNAENKSPLDFFEANGGRKYSELGGIYLISLDDILKQLKDSNIYLQFPDPEKQTVGIQYTSPTESWKKFYLFEDEAQLFISIMRDIEPLISTAPDQVPGFCEKVNKLVSPWVVDKISIDQLLQEENQCESLPRTRRFG
ncbi:MAG: hypothetical protein A3F42_04290 [Gammaproteobacteria bacterium RIFCSPHIGHO2_12_FULL_37_34]|nr:MAG: hypothetical protein A3F42_04290 [Gammaproteobacteria bacterium RIFCSPHIGHO2_12_FULL_37_34]